MNRQPLIQLLQISHSPHNKMSVPAPFIDLQDTENSSEYAPEGRDIYTRGVEW